MRRGAHLQHHAVCAFDRNGFFAHAQIYPGPLVPNAVGIFRIHGERHQIGVVVLEHGQAPTKVAVVAQQGHRVEGQKVAIQLKARAAQVGLVPNRWHRVGDVRVSRQQGATTGRALTRHHPGVAALEHRHARHIHRRMRPAHPLAGIAQRCGALGNGNSSWHTRRTAVGQRHRWCRHWGRGRLTPNAIGLPRPVKQSAVGGAEFIVDLGQHRFGAKPRGKAVGHVCGHAEGIGQGERLGLDAQKVKLQRQRPAALKLVHPIQIREHRLPGFALGVKARSRLLGMVAQAHGAKHPIGVQQFGAQDGGQLAFGQAAHHLHLEQTVLRVHKAQCAVQVGLVLGLQMGHAKVVVMHLNGSAQTCQRQVSIALGQAVAPHAQCQQHRPQDQPRHPNRNFFHSLPQSWWPLYRTGARARFHHTCAQGCDSGALP